ncbi:MAG: efflux RND transporter periplasmic adaptor subunit [Acidobacteriota bacterium]
MRKVLIVAVVLALGGAGYWMFLRREQPAAAAGQSAGPGADPGGPRGGGGGGFGGFGGPGGGGGFRPPMTVEVAKVSRGRISTTLSVVGNLIGEATVEVAPKTGGRLTSVTVKLGDRVRRGQVIAKVEDREIIEQVRQAEASHQVAEASIRQREADLTLAETSVERSRNLFGRQLLPKQTLDDSEARYQAAQAQLDLVRAQLAQSAARLEELRINLANTNVVSPVDGFVARRHVDPGAWVSQNLGVASIVDISSLRLVANVVEKDLRMVTVGDRATVEVDAFPGERFAGAIARVSPVLDPATRTAPMEIEIPNQQYRLKPGMYAKVNLEVEVRENVLLIPKVSLTDSGGRRGVYQAGDDGRARFLPITVGLENPEQAEVASGLSEGDLIVSVGAGALRANDQLVVSGLDGQSPAGGRGVGRGGRGGPGETGPGEGTGRGGRGGRGGPGQTPGGGAPGQRGQRPPTGSDQPDGARR